MFHHKILILVAFIAAMALIAACPSDAKADIPQTNETNTQLLNDNGGAIPEEKPSPPVEKWTGRVKFAGKARQINVNNPSKPLVEGSKAIIYKGLAYAPINSPKAVKAIIWTGNKIRSLPYKWGGGHGSWNDSGYDCSGSVSYALHGAKLITSPAASGAYYSWGKSGSGKWITIYTNSGHIYMTIAGVRFDTSGANPSRWQMPKNDNSGYSLRHPINL
jgi:cell wall-associated NlpC family hydrolase